MVLFGTSAKGFYIFLSNYLLQLLIINEGSPFKVAFENVHIVYAWNMYPLDGINVFLSFSKKWRTFSIYTQSLFRIDTYPVVE